MTTFAPPKAVIFDLDGTLVDSTPDIALALNRTLADRGLGPLDIEIVRTLIGEGATRLIELAYEALRVPVGDLDAEVTRYIKYSYEKPVQRSSLYRDAKPALHAMADAGVALGVCTNKSEGLAREVLKHFGLLGIMSSVVGADSTPNRKPHPMPLLRAIEEIGVSVDACLYVGDTEIDRDCAAAAGMRCRIVDWGLGPGVATSGPRLDSFSEILAEDVGFQIE
ncbi:HAD-IA family hydrolase [Salinisphaera hydrothermalis]|uniref:HAD-IA family hydrolase n=1 Tax=Salinisphaera hydrothermalis TaxID=563188 RepID=UPI0033413B40